MLEGDYAGAGARRRCRAPGCKSSCNDGEYYCPIDFEALCSGLVGAIEIVYEHAREVYIGRTHYPEQRLLQHREKRDHLAVLHWAGDRGEIKILEEHLIREMKKPTKSGRNRLKVGNDSDASEGRWASHWNCVYVAWQWRDGAGRWPGFIEVEELDWGRRICPERSALVKRPDFLFTTLTPDAARRELEAHDRRVAAHRPADIGPDGSLREQ